MAGSNPPGSRHDRTLPVRAAERRKERKPQKVLAGILAGMVGFDLRRRRDRAERSRLDRFDTATTQPVGSKYRLVHGLPPVDPTGLWLRLVQRRHHHVGRHRRPLRRQCEPWRNPVPAGRGRFDSGTWPPRISPVIRGWSMSTDFVTALQPAQDWMAAVSNQVKAGGYDGRVNNSVTVMAPVMSPGDMDMIRASAA